MTSWEAVLAAVEADVQQAEALLSSSAAPADPVPASAEPPLLPPLALMPPVPPALVPRITLLRDRIVELEAGFQRELAAARRRPEPNRTRVLARSPRYFDRRV